MNFALPSDPLELLKLFLFLAGVLGLGHFAADLLRALWVQFKGFALKSPTKIDDFFVSVFGARIDRAIDLIDKGDVAGGIERLKQLKAAADGKR